LGYVAGRNGGRRGPESPGASGGGFRYERLDEICGGDLALRGEILAKLIEATTRAVAIIEEALAAGDGARLAHEAHGVAGICLTVGAESLAASARDLEVLGRQADLSEARRRFARFRCE
jgi:HPt (histidine-containing phosphotransfer) domain-containing protein